jgi:aspartate kinase
MIVMKFGGSSVADAERIRRMADIVRGQSEKQPVVVLSAMGDTTDILLEAGTKAISEGPVSVEHSLFKLNEIHLETITELCLAKSAADELRPLLEELGGLLAGISLIREVSDKTRDYLVSFGERLSVRVAASYLRSCGINARAFDAWDAGITSDSRYNNAEPLNSVWDTIPRALLPALEAGILPIVTGFIARDTNGVITTLGRGGSDLTATLIAAACKAEEVQIWKDVDGIMSADPRLVKNARPVAAATYDEAAELAYFGAQVLHPRAMQPCSKSGTPVRVKNSYNPQAAGTVISAALVQNAPPVRAITSRRNVTLVDIVSSRMLGQWGFLGEVFGIFTKWKASVDVVATSEVSISLTLDSAFDLENIVAELSAIAACTVKKGRAIVTIVGDVRQSSAILKKAFGVCERIGIQVQMISQGASKVNISFVVSDTEAEPLVKELHRELFDI